MSDELKTNEIPYPEDRESLFNWFEEMIRSPLNMLMEKAIQDGALPIGYTCSYIPRVILSVKPFVPYRIFAPGVSSTEMADTYLPSTLCSYTRSMLEFAINGGYDFLKGWVLASSCQHMNRFFDNLKHAVTLPFAHLVDLPHRTGDSARKWMADELHELIRTMSDHFKIAITDQHLHESIERHNGVSKILLDISEMRKKSASPLSGADFHKLMMASLVTPQDLIVEPLNVIKKRLQESNAATDDFRARLVLMGGQLDNPAFIDAIEQAGGLVVADRICTGSIPGLDPYPNDGDPVERIASHILTKTSCPRMMDAFQERLSAIIDTYENYRADGIVIEAIKFCDTWGLEARELSDSLRQRGIPVLKLEREYRHTGEGQLRTRVQAFIESMGK